MLDGPQSLEINRVNIAVWERPGAGRPLLLAHATGFHSHCWTQVIRRVPHRHCILIDHRGHGHSGKPAPPYHWPQFGEDVAAITRELGLKRIAGAGHSMGGHALAHAAVLVPDLFSELLLIDPVILPPGLYRDVPAEAHFARKRRNRWQSPEEMFERYVIRPPFNEWDRAVVRDYCEHGLLPDADGYVLACPPEVEASIYEHCTVAESNLNGRFGGVDAEVTVIRSARPMRWDGPMDMAGSPTDPGLAAQFRRGRDVHTCWSHFLPMEAPAFVAEYLS